ncbi:unnamed protein product [Urochloa humidicola]
MSSPWAKPGTSICVEGFDSSLHVEEIRTMLARRFGYNNEGIAIPTNWDGASIGKAYIKCGSWCYFSEALNQNVSKLGENKLRITEFHGGGRFWDGHITPNHPGTGKVASEQMIRACKLCEVWTIVTPTRSQIGSNLF